MNNHKDKLESSDLEGGDDIVFFRGITLADFEPRKRGAGKEVERILTDADKPLHLKRIMAELELAGFTNTYQTISGILQILCKKKKVFKKVAPATYALIDYKKPAKKRPIATVDAAASVVSEANSGGRVG